MSETRPAKPSTCIMCGEERVAYPPGDACARCSRTPEYLALPAFPQDMLYQPKIAKSVCCGGAVFRQGDPKGLQVSVAYCQECRLRCQVEGEVPDPEFAIPAGTTRDYLGRPLSATAAEESVRLEDV